MDLRANPPRLEVSVYKIVFVALIIAVGAIGYFVTAGDAPEVSIQPQYNTVGLGPSLSNAGPDYDAAYSQNYLIHSSSTY